MPHNSSPDPDPDDSDTEYIEVDPSGRYGRYKEVLGKGAFKKVYRAFDTLEGIEVAWNQVKVADLLHNSEDLERLYSEVNLLKTLKHKNIIKFYHSWVDTKNKNINFLTEIFTSGTYDSIYRNKHKRVDLRAVKKWSKQILDGLIYLHSHDPPVIHRDLKCDNIFVNGNNGEVKIGDLGLAAILCKARSAHSVIELVTFEYPYVECSNAAQIYKKVTSCKLCQIADLWSSESLGFSFGSTVVLLFNDILRLVSDRLPARELLVDPFLQLDEDNKTIIPSLPPNPNASESSHAVPEGSRDFTVQGQRKDLNTIFLKLRIPDSTGHIRNIYFPFDIDVETALGVASEMVEQLDLTDQDVSAIAKMIESEIYSNNDVSPSKNEFPSPVGNLKLERLPSGRKYWSNSPKKAGGNYPDNPGPSNLSLEGSLTQENERGSNNVASLERMEDEHMVDENLKKKQVHVNADLQFDENNSATDPHQLGLVGYSETVNDMDSNDVRIIAEKLGHLLVEQKKEMDELKRRNELAVSDILKELPPETRHKVVSDSVAESNLDCSLLSAIYSLVLRIFANKESVKQFWATITKMKELGFYIDEATYLTVLGVFRNSKMGNDVTAWTQLYNKMVKENEMSDVVKKVVGVVTRVLGRDDSIGEFWSMVKEMQSLGHEMDIDTYIKISRQFQKNKMLKDAVELYELMMDGPYKPSAQDCGVLLRTISVGGNANMDLVYRVVDKHEAAGNVLTKSDYDGIHRALTSVGRFDEAEKIRLEEASKVLNLMEANGCIPDIKTWTILIKGHCAANEVDKALFCFANMMEKNCDADADLLDVLVNGFISQNRIEGANQLVVEMVNKVRLRPWQATYKSLIQRLLEKRKFEEALNLLHLMKKHNYPPSPEPFVHFISRFGTVEDAGDFLKALSGKEYPSISAYLHVFKAFFQEGRDSEAKDLLFKCPHHIRKHEAICSLFGSAKSSNAAAA
ncbi:hypothetical protein C3L33_14382, partial [Rhododendron williamsianum]